MPKVFIEETTLTAIGNAIREKTGKTELIDPALMSEEIASIEAGGGGVELPEEAFQQSGNFANRFQNGSWDWYINLFGDKVTTSNITSLMSAFENSKVESVPFTLNVVNVTQMNNAFHYVPLRTCPRIRGTVGTTNPNYKVFYYNHYLRDAEDLFESNFVENFSQSKVTSAYSCPIPNNFTGCNSLRTIPSWWYHFKLNPESTAYPTSSYHLYYMPFFNCRALDEIRDIMVWWCNCDLTSNIFSSTFQGSSRAKTITFETNDGQPIEVRWKNQVIDLTIAVGYCSNTADIMNYNSGITADKEVKDDATYQALKNDPDWFTSNFIYSRYNHDSAVETINSLPDTSAYLATAGGTNTIKFKKAAGSATDGGAIETLTAEEIAVAAAKGWTVTLVN